MNKIVKHYICFDRGSRYWFDDHNYNVMFLKNQEHYFNDYLRYYAVEHGYICLARLYEMLGVKPTEPNVFVSGWTKSYLDSKSYIDFGLEPLLTNDYGDIVLTIEVETPFD